MITMINIIIMFESSTQSSICNPSTTHNPETGRDRIKNSGAQLNLAWREPHYNYVPNTGSTNIQWEYGAPEWPYG